MKAYFSHFSRHLSASLLIILTSPLCLAQVPVVDAAGSGNQPQTTSGAQNNNSELLLTLYNQIDQLQREVANLRGMVEEQSFQIRRMQTEQRDRYIDVDQRLTELSMGTQAGQSVPGVTQGQGTASPAFGGSDPARGNTAVSGQAVPGGGNDRTPGRVSTGADDADGADTGTGFTPAAVNTGLPANSRIPAGSSPGPTTVGGPVPTAQNEEEIYTSALDLLLSESRIEEAIAGFGRYIDAYPNGQFLANAFYWQGEALILVDRYAQAESVFRKVLDDYPTHAKAADAMLKLGVVYERTGNTERAREAWESISVRYPQSTNTIRVAQDYLSHL